MADERRDFGEYYPGGGVEAYTPPAENVAGRVAAVEGKMGIVAAAAAALPELDPDGDVPMADVKQGLNGVKGALEELA